MTEPVCEIYSDGTKRWYLNGLLHRENGPAVEWADGTKKWYLNGLLHRENGPAIEYPDGSSFWSLNGKYHRENGPAIEWVNGTKRWYINGTEITDKVNSFIKEYDLPDYTEWTEQDWFLFKMYI